jgi:hypothetical protein
MPRVLVLVVSVLLTVSSAAAQPNSTQSPTILDGQSGIVGGVTGGIVTSGPFPGPVGQIQAGPALVTGRSTVRGRVVAANTGEPVRRATVRVSAPELRGQKLAQTDSDGRYEVRDLPAGRYSVRTYKVIAVPVLSVPTRRSDS